MNTPIKTNKLKIFINRDEYEKKYDIFLISTSDKYLHRGAYIIDAPLLCNNVLSICFDSGKEFYVLMRKDDSNRTLLKNVIEKPDGGDALTISLVKYNQVKDNILVQLLLNSLSNYESDFMRFSNLTGHLYCFHPKWLKRSKVNGKYAITKVPCLEFKVSDDMVLIMQIHTFTSELLRNDITFKKKKFEDYPKYVFSANNTLRRRLKDDKDTCFIMRQTDGVKTEIPFLDIESKDKFDMCKMGILVSLFEIFNCKMGDVCKLEFSEINDYVSVERTRTMAKEDENSIIKFLEIKSIRIVDEIKDEYSTTFCKLIKDKLKEKYAVSASIGTYPSKATLNICVIHNGAYYEGMEDPHRKKREGYTIQHVTFEDFMGSVDFALSSVIHELLIKHDIINRKISLFDWAKLGINEKISFGLRVKNEDGDRYFFMEVNPDGSFVFNEQMLNLFEINQFTECVNVFEDNPSVCGIIKRENGDISLISDTDWITIPEVTDINNELRAGNTKLRGKIKREELLILSQNAIFYSYALYLIAKYRFNASDNDNMHLTSLWFFYASLVSLYTGSFESTVENHLNSIKQLNTIDEYKNFIFSRINERLTNDYFDITLIGSEGLAVSGRGNNAWNAYVAALIILDAKVLFSKSNLLLSKLFEPGTDGNRKSLEKHHLFPKAYLKSKGYTDAKINQMANYAFIDWKDNMEILDDSPSVYYPVVCAGMNDDQIKAMEEENALPHGWEKMSYEDFLVERRKLMAAKIKVAYERLKNNAK